VIQHIFPSQLIVFGHRGAKTAAPENTLASFQEALRQGADGVELDAQLTADGEVVVIHDATVNRTTNGTGAVRKLRLEELQRLDAGNWFGEAFRGQKIPTLAEVFETFGGTLRVDVELKNYASPADNLAGKVADLIRRYGLEKSCLVSSFFPTNLARFRGLIPEMPAGIIALRGAPGALSRGWLGRWFAPQCVVPYFTDLSPAYLAAQKKMNRRVIPWTVNQPEDLRAMNRLGVDAVITDLPSQARAFLAGLQTPPGPG
jgi:glycerophosphoryl diester phosphodiesterase